jgi:hypothetical protein
MSSKWASKFNYDEIVILHPVDSKMKIACDTKGIINGKAVNEQGEWSYSVSLELNGETWCFDENELESTGNFSDSNKDLTSHKVRMSVNENGEGEIKENN